MVVGIVCFVLPISSLVRENTSEQKLVQLVLLSAVKSFSAFLHAGPQ